MIRRITMPLLAAALCFAFGCPEEGSEGEATATATEEEGAAEQEGAAEEEGAEDEAAAEQEGAAEDEGGEETAEAEGSDLTGACKEYQECCNALMAWAKDQPGGEKMVSAYKQGCESIEQVASTPDGEQSCKTAMDAIKKGAANTPDYPEECK